MAERWKEVTYPGITPKKFLVSDKGNVKCITGDEPKISILGKFRTITDGASIYQISRMVYWEFVEKYDLDKYSIIHRDKDVLNDSYSNLYKEQHVRLTDDEVHIVCKSLVKHSGNAKVVNVVFDELITIIPYLKIFTIHAIKNKTAYRNISDKYFTHKIDSRKYSSGDIDLICASLIKNNGSPSITYDELRDRIDGLNIDDIKSIKGKRSYIKESDKYFNKNFFKLKKEPVRNASLGGYLKKETTTYVTLNQLFEYKRLDSCRSYIDQCCIKKLNICNDDFIYVKGNMIFKYKNRSYIIMTISDIIKTETVAIVSTDGLILDANVSNDTGLHIITTMQYCEADKEIFNVVRNAFSDVIINRLDVDSSLIDVMQAKVNYGIMMIERTSKVHKL